ncbi:uncharacterized protein MYCGRDRAFT_108910 [Zymoseptoria tritici IPO323]|uniref:Uncharacterized protein n=1 Tax=Zymoseptoria tritici (strain CBS 115943 / IPO323) TaxID=336722 RepID=F9X818_ZYMTI|nr:uncharacterized protein MYCGRDRAFT_108910 [Zymoseptoria tritici IPO323]EGP89113.1 hypothetical protein MYCGRDRAFT_108910 [Zymoseptoria tritici IPO323]
METESFTPTGMSYSETDESCSVNAYPPETPAAGGMPSILGYFDAIDTTGNPVDLPSDPFTQAKEFRRLYNNVAAQRRKKALRQDRLMYEFECLRHHLDFVAESHAELDSHLQNFSEDEASAFSSIMTIRDVHDQLKMDHQRSQEQAEKIMALERKMHVAEEKLEREEDRLADFTEVWMRQTDRADSWAGSDGAQSSPEVALSPSVGCSSPATIVGSPVISPADATDLLEEDFDGDAVCCSYAEDGCEASPSESFGFAQFEPPSPLDLGSPKIAPPQCPLYASSPRVSVR